MYMTIQQTGAASAALYLTPADLKRRGIKNHSDLTLEQALALTSDAFREAGIALDGPIEIEAFPDACGVLIFAHIRPPEQVWMVFSGFELLLSALHSLTVPCRDGVLYWWEGEYWLRLSDPHAALTLSEFGRREPASPQQEALLTEHASLILARDAPSTLLRHFPSP